MDKASLKKSVMKILDDLPLEQGVEVLDFAEFVKHRSLQPAVKAISADQLESLTGLVAWGGDALADTERLYDND